MRTGCYPHPSKTQAKEKLLKHIRKASDVREYEKNRPELTRAI